MSFNASVRVIPGDENADIAITADATAGDRNADGHGTGADVVA